MKRFFVGQRVRVVAVIGTARRSSKKRAMEGREARIVEMGQAPNSARDCTIEITGHGRWGALFSQLEPIMPDGNRPSQFSTVDELLDSLRSEISA